jgi:proteic killer suppression protein
MVSPLRLKPCAGYKPHDHCIASRYSGELIKSFRHTGLEKFFRDGSKAGINPAHANKLENQLAVLNRAAGPCAMNLPGWNLHPLKGELAGNWAVKVNGNWRMAFRVEEEDAILGVCRR